MPCMELFAAQDDKYRRRVLPAGPVRIGIEPLFVKVGIAGYWMNVENQQRLISLG